MSKTKELFWTFFKIGAFTFGGGYAMVALLQNEFVEEKKWVTKEEFLDMVAIAESTPGPVAVNSATYIGYKIEGTAGAAAAQRLSYSAWSAARCAITPPTGTVSPSPATRWMMPSSGLSKGMVVFSLSISART